MTRLTTVVVGTVAALAIGAPAMAVAASSADARAARSWTTIQRLGGAKQEACKVSADGGSTWKVYNRVDARNAGDRVQARMTVTHNGVSTWRKWSSGWVHKGTISDVGTFTIPRASGYGISHSISADNMGNGGEMTAAGIGHC
jgi:hypothetical protein